MATPSTKPPASGFMKFTIPFLGHHYYIFGFSNLSLRVEKRFLKK